MADWWRGRYNQTEMERVINQNRRVKWGSDGKESPLENIFEYREEMGPIRSTMKEATGVQ